MLGIPPAAQDFHHAYARNNSQGNEGPVYESLAQASEDNTGTNCYILSSTTDPTWLVVCGRNPSGFDEHRLASWFRDVKVKGRIDKRLVQACI